MRNAATRSKQLLPRLYEVVKVIIVAQPSAIAADRNVISSVGCIHSSDEVAVMAMEPRGTVIQC